MPTITILEPSVEYRKRAELEEAAGVPIGELRDILKPLVDLRGSLDSDDVAISPGTMIGTIRVGGLRVDVKPRMANQDIVTLIRYAYEGDCSISRSEVAPDADGIDELLCRVLVDELDMIRQRGVSRLYVNRKQSLSALRGRPDFLASFPWNERGMTSLTCRYHELSCDTLDNQLILAALDVAILMDVLPLTRGRLNAHRHAWHELATVHAVSVVDFAQARLAYTRLTEHYRLAHCISEMILMRRRPYVMYDATPIVTSGIALDMAELFELAVYRMVRDSLGIRGYTVRYQCADARALSDGDGERYRSIRPDVLVYRGDTPVGVIDAKYKDYWEAERRRLSPVQRISNEDLYQLFFYASRLQAAHHLPTAPRAIIIAPMPDEVERQGRLVVPDRYRTVKYVAGHAVTTLSLELLCLSDAIRELRASGFNGAQCPSIRHVADRLALGEPRCPALHEAYADSVVQHP